MRFFFLLLLLLGIEVPTVQAYDLSVTTVSEPYEITPINADVVTEQGYLGQLEDFPIMYEFVSAASTTLTAQIAQRYQSGGKETQFSLMVVRQNDNNGGVTEVVRLNPKAEDWLIKKDAVWGMSFWETAVIDKDIGPGTYRLEVSTPDNTGRYLLKIGANDERSGYFETLGAVRVVQKFFGLSALRILRSSYVYYPLGILLLLYGFYRANRYRNLLSDVN